MAMLLSFLNLPMAVLLVFVVGTEMLGQEAPTQGHGQAPQLSMAARLDLVGGSDETTENGIGAGTASTPQKLSSYYYQILPSLEINANGQRSVLHLSYTFGLSEDPASPFGNTDSQLATATLSQSLGRDWKINISDSFVRTSNLGAFNASLGTTSSVPNALSYLYYASAVNQISENNYVQVRTDYGLTPQSTLSLSGSYSLLKYPNGGPFAGDLSNQQGSSLGITYTHKTSERDSWNLAFGSSYYTFGNLGSAQSQAVSAGYSHRFANEFLFQVVAGPSYVDSSQSVDGSQTGGHYVGFNGSASLQKSLKTSTIRVYFAQTSGAASGFGSISNTRNAGFTLKQGIAKNLSLSADISAFDMQGQFGNLYAARGGSATAMIGLALNQTVSLNWGGLYQRYDQATPFGFDEKRLFVTLRYNAPGLWRSSR